MFGIFKKKNNDLEQINQNFSQPIIPETNIQPIETHADILNSDVVPLSKPTRKDVIVPTVREIEPAITPELDFDTIEVKSRPNTQSAMQLATFTDLSSLAKRTPIFVFRDKKANTYFGIIEGRIFYLKK